MNAQVVPEHDRRTEISVSTTGCAHQRLIDDVRTGSGSPTGKVRCRECGTVFDDPHHKAL